MERAAFRIYCNVGPSTSPLSLLRCFLRQHLRVLQHGLRRTFLFVRRIAVLAQDPLHVDAMHYRHAVKVHHFLHPART